MEIHWMGRKAGGGKERDCESLTCIEDLYYFGYPRRLLGREYEGQGMSCIPCPFSLECSALMLFFVVLVDICIAC